jgi:hypothetical protein
VTNTNPVFNLNSPLVNKLGKIIPPWNSFFQQFTQKAPAVANVTQNPFTANAIGKLILTGATGITLTRGSVNIDLTGVRIIPISIGDTVSWSGNATAQFLGGI